MMRLTDRRAVLLAAGTAAAVAVSGSVSAQATPVRGTVDYEGGKLIPEGYLVISVDHPGDQDATHFAGSRVRLESDGASREIEFTMPVPAPSAGMERARIVASLERADGWLLARGSAEFDLDDPLAITLFTAMY